MGKMKKKIQLSLQEEYITNYYTVKHNIQFIVQLHLSVKSVITNKKNA